MSSVEAKIVVLGSQGVGKTSLVTRYARNAFTPGSTHSTVGASFITKRVLDDDSNTTVRLQIWDTAGQERFRSISKLYYRGANAAILAYDITDASSFEEMGRWLKELRKELGEDVVVHVVGTKSDLVAEDPSLRKVPFERCIAYVAEQLYPEQFQGQVSTPPATGSSRGGGGGGGAADVQSPGSKRSSGFWGQEIGWDTCHEISAKDGEGVEEVFRVITRKLVEQRNKTCGLEMAVERDRMPGIERAGSASESRSRGRGDPTGGGSFRVGRDRRSWMGFPPGVGIQDLPDGETMDEGPKGKKGKCC